MKAIQVTAPGKFVVLEAPTPEPGPGEILMRVEAVTTCPQWDLHLRHDEPMFVGHRFHYPYPPGQPGHEATGTVAGVGAGVAGLAVGDRISAWRDPGHAAAGCYAQFAIRKAEDVIVVPADLSYAATAPVELAMCVGSVLLMLREMRVLEGRRFGVTGLGPAGLIACQMIRAEGAAEVIGFDPSASRREFAMAHSFLDAAFDPKADLDGSFPSRPSAPALDCAVDCVGAKASVEFMMDRTRDVVALFGVQREEYAFAVRHYSNLRLCGYRGHSRAAAEYVVGLIEGRALDLSPLSTHDLPLERYNDGIELLERQEAIKICFRPWV